MNATNNYAASAAEPVGYLWRSRHSAADAEQLSPGGDHGYLWKYSHGTSSLAACEANADLEVLRLYAAPAAQSRESGSTVADFPSVITARKAAESQLAYYRSMTGSTPTQMQSREPLTEKQIDDLAHEAGCHKHRYSAVSSPDLDGRYLVSAEELDSFARAVERAMRSAAPAAPAAEHAAPLTKTEFSRLWREHMGSTRFSSDVWEAKMLTERAHNIGGKA